MPLLTNIEKRALVRGQEMGAKETRKQDISKILQKRFTDVPENILDHLNNIEEMSILEQLFLESISVNSLAEFQQLINNSLS